MFRIFGIALVVVLTISFPPLAVVTIPAGMLWAFKVRDRRAEQRRQVNVFTDWQAEQERIKALRRFS